MNRIRTDFSSKQSPPFLPSLLPISIPIPLIQPHSLSHQQQSQYKLQNKMNKKIMNRLVRTRKKTQTNRIIYKNRNNHREAENKSPTTNQNQYSLSQSHFTPPEYDDDNLRQTQKTTLHRMKTEYHDQYRKITTVPERFRQITSPFDQYAPPTQTRQHKNNNEKQHQQSTLNAQQTPFPQKEEVEQTNRQISSHQNNNHPLIISNLEQQLDDSLEKRLRTCLSFNKSADWRQSNNFNPLVDAVRKLKINCNPEQQQDQTPSNKKISLLEKLMAENFLEAQILKKYYFSKVTKPSARKCKTTSLRNFQIPSTNLQHTPKYNQVGFIQSTASRNSFQRPDSNSYKFQRKKHDFFRIDKASQPIPRSSYGRQFLSYKGLTSIPSSKPIDSPIMKAASSAKILQTSYKTQFIPKTAQKINLKDLDACKNKIKNLPITFSKKQNQQAIGQLNRYLQSKRTTKSVQKHQEIPFLKSYLITESRRQFSLKSDPSPPKIKNEALQKLRYNFKNKFHI